MVCKNKENGDQAVTIFGFKNEYFICFKPYFSLCLNLSRKQITNVFTTLLPYFYSQFPDLKYGTLIR